MEINNLQDIENLLAGNKLDYRQGVIAIVINSKDELLVVQSNSFADNEWKFPSGGLKEQESHEDALMRELEEELGTTSVEIIKKSSVVNSYDWTKESILAQYQKKGVLFKGQQQVQFLVKFIGQESEINLEVEELRSCKWITKETLKDHLLFDGQLDLTLRTLNDLDI